MSPELAPRRPDNHAVGAGGVNDTMARIREGVAKRLWYRVGGRCALIHSIKSAP
jgi:hypothetical protein